MTYPTATLEEVWALFKETDRKFQETDREITRLSQESDRKFRELSQESDRKFRELSQENQLMMKELTKKIGDLGNRLGEFVEGLIKPSVVAIFQRRGINVHKVHSDVEARNEDLRLATEIDLLVVNEDTCVLIEVKSRLTTENVNEHIKRLKKFKPLFPEYRDKKALGAVAGMVITDKIADYAYRKGFFVIGQRGENAVILNDEDFKPTAW